MNIYKSKENGRCLVSGMSHNKELVSSLSAIYLVEGKLAESVSLLNKRHLTFPEKHLALHVPFSGLLKYLFYTLRAWIIQIFNVVNVNVRNIRFKKK